MSNIDFRGLRIDIATPVGILTEAKVNKIRESFTDCEIKFYIDSLLFLDNNNTGESLILAPNQVSFAFRKEPISFDNALKGLEKAFDALLLDKMAPCRIRIIGHYKSNKSSMENSMSFINANSADFRKAYPSCTGIGLRFIEKHGDNVWEFKLEPLIRDERFYHIEGIFNFNEKNSLKMITNKAEETYTYYNTTLTSVAEHFFIK